MDWKCPGPPPSDVKSTPSDVGTGAQGDYYLPYNLHFAPYYQKCLGVNNGDCAKTPSGLSDANTQPGCNPIDFGQTLGWTANAGNLLYPGTSQSFPGPPYDTNGDLLTNNRSVCWKMPTQ